MDDPDKLSMFRNREEIRALEEVVDALTNRVHRLELKTGGVEKPRDPWMAPPRK